MSGFGFSENSVYHNSRVFELRNRTEHDFLRRTDLPETNRAAPLHVFQNKLIFQGDCYKTYPKGPTSFKHFCVIKFGSATLKLIQFLSMVIILKLTFDFMHECKQIKEKDYFYFSSDSMRYITELLYKAFVKFLNFTNCVCGFLLFLFSCIHSFLVSQKELVEEACLVYFELEDRLMEKKIVDKTFFDEEFYKMDFINRKKIVRIRRYLYQLINTDPKILFMRNRTNLQLFVLRS